MFDGRFVGSFVMQRVAPELLLAGVSIGAFVVMVLAAVTTGPVAMWALISSGCSIQSCSRRSSPSASAGSGR